MTEQDWTGRQERDRDRADRYRNRTDIDRTDRDRTDRIGPCSDGKDSNCFLAFSGPTIRVRGRVRDGESWGVVRVRVMVQDKGKG